MKIIRPTGDFESAVELVYFLAENLVQVNEDFWRVPYSPHDVATLGQATLDVLKLYHGTTVC